MSSAFNGSIFYDLVSNDSNSNNSFNASNGTDVLFLSPFDLVWKAGYTVGTIIPNAILLYILIFSVKEKGYSNSCFISLTLCDLAVGLICIPMNILYSLPNGIVINFYLGVFITITSYAQPSVGLYLLIPLTWHRLKQLIWPLQSTERVTLLRKFVLIAMWVVIYVAWILIVVVFILVDYYDPDTPDISPPSYMIIILSGVFYFFPLLVNTLLTTMTIFILVEKHRQRLAISGGHKRLNVANNAASMSQIIKQEFNNSNNRGSFSIQEGATAGGSFSTTSTVRKQSAKNSATKRNQKAVMCLVTIILVLVLTQTLYTICWPLYVYNIVQDQNFYLAIVWLSFANSLFNPFILLVFHENIRQALRKMLKCF